jgi:hypothetical protein
MSLLEAQYTVSATETHGNIYHEGTLMRYEYKVLGKDTVEVGGLGVALIQKMDQPKVVEGVLNALAEDDWEPVLLQPPFVFRRPKG